MAQLVARLVRNEKVGGSNPPSSTISRHPVADVGFSYVRACYRPSSVHRMAGVVGYRRKRGALDGVSWV